MYQDGVYEGPSDYSRTTIRLNAGREFNKVVSLKTRATYARTFSNRIQTGSNLNGLYLGMLRAAPDFDGSGYIGSYFASPNAAPVLNRHRSYRRYLGNATNPIYNNPLWTINEQENTTLVNRYIVSSELSIKPVNWFEFIARGGIDAYDDERKTLFPVHSAGSRQNGRYDEFVFKESQLNLALIGKLNTAITPDILGTFLVGWNINDRNYNRLGFISENFLIPGGPGDVSNAGPGSAKLPSWPTLSYLLPAGT